MKTATSKRFLCAALFLLLCRSGWGEERPMSFLQLGSMEGVVTTQQMPRVDDALSHRIPIPGGLTMGRSTFYSAYVCTNGYIAIGSPYLSYVPSYYSPRNRALVAPFFYDIDLSNGGDIEYEVHTHGPVLDSVSAFVSKDRETDFHAKWMLLVYWNKVAPLNPARSHPVSQQTNSFQAAILANETDSYAVFTYNCRQMDYSARALIGFTVHHGYDIYAYHPLSRTWRAQSVACLNNPRSPWTNIVYELSTDLSEGSGGSGYPWSSGGGDPTRIDDEDYTPTDGYDDDIDLEEPTHPVSVSGHVTISGHDTPLVVGHIRHILCRAEGTEVVRIEGYLGGNLLASVIDSNVLLLSIHPENEDINGSRLTCKVYDTHQRQIETSVTLAVQGNNDRCVTEEELDNLRNRVRRQLRISQRDILTTIENFRH